MPVLTRLAATPDVAVLHSVCAGAADDPDQPERLDRFQLVVPRHGAFRRATDAAGEHLVDPTVAYLGLPGEDQLITHSRSGGGDAGRVFALSARLAPERLAAAGGRPVRLAAAADLFERSFVARLHGAGPAVDALEVEEGVARLCALLDPLDHCPRSTSAVDRARELLAERLDDPLSLVELARLVGYSPHHLSRTFARATGLTLTRYRRRLRVRAALARLEQGADDLSGLAAEVGFFDHSHLVSACRAETGQAPSRLRRLVAAG